MDRVQMFESKSNPILDVKNDKPERVSRPIVIPLKFLQGIGEKR